jgi:IclR family transcriptional regulator, acetate operon repressor
VATPVDRCLDVLELLADDAGGMPLSAIALRLGLPKSGAHRLLGQLAARGFVSQDAASQRYRLTMRLAVLGFRYLASTGLTEVCKPELDRLALETGELVRLAIVEGLSLTWVAEAQGARQGLRYEGDYGRGVRLHATATGKAWLATLPETDAVRIVLAQGFAAQREMGPRAIRTVPGLIDELARTRAQGYATAFEEGEPGMAAVAAAIPGRQPDDPVVGTVSAAGPIVRLSMERMHRIAPSLQRTARAIGELWPIRLHHPAGQRLAAQRREAS